MLRADPDKSRRNGARRRNIPGEHKRRTYSIGWTQTAQGVKSQRTRTRAPCTPTLEEQAGQEYEKTVTGNENEWTRLGMPEKFDQRESGADMRFNQPGGFQCERVSAQETHQTHVMRGSGSHAGWYTHTPQIGIRCGVGTEHEERNPRAGRHRSQLGGKIALTHRMNQGFVLPG